MAGTRQSARVAAQSNNSSPPSATPSSGTKRKADADATSPTTTKGKRGRPAKQQKSLEEVIPDEGKREEVKAAVANEADEGNGEEADDGDDEKAEGQDTNGEADNNTKTEDSHANGNGTAKANDEKPNAFDKVQADENDEGATGAGTEDTKDTNGNKQEPKEDANADIDDKAVEEDKTREEAQPSNVLEKGVIYFFTRGRVGTSNPDSVQDLQRSFFVMRPLPAGGKITDGAVQEMKNLRLLALPKKVWPKSGKDRFMSFVEKAGTTMADLKESFMSGSEYSTKTTGTNHTPNVTLVGEGVYAFTNTGGGRGTSHIAYMLTVPTSPGEVQDDMGIKDKGSFVISLKNPESSGPANAQLPQGPDYPREFIDEFGGRGWMPAEPKHIDYANAQILMIGEDFENSTNLEANPKDEKDDAKELPEEELKKLESEDEQRVQHLKGDDTIFADLGVSKKDYGITTTW